MSQHFVAMAGHRGYLPSFCEPADTVDEAVAILADTFEFGRVRQRRLKHDRLIYITESIIPTDEPLGIEYAEIQTCSCSDPSVHAS